MNEQKFFKQDVDYLGGYMGFPEISAILKPNDGGWHQEESKFFIEHEQSKILDSLKEDSVDFPD